MRSSRRRTRGKLHHATALFVLVATFVITSVSQAQSPDVAGRIDQLQRQLDQLRSEVEPAGPTNLSSPSMPPLVVDYVHDGSLARLPAAALTTSTPPPTSPPAAPIKYPTLTINGVFQADMGFLSQDTVNRATVGNAVDGADFRRARLSAKGAVSETVNYFMQMDFGFFGRPTFTDVWIEQTDLPVLGNLRIGQWKQPFSLEVVSSFRYTTFMERSLLFQPFTAFRHLGIGFYDHAEDLNSTWAVSGFRSGQDQFGGSASNGAGWGTAERFTWLPWYDDASSGRGYLHLGAAHYFSTPQDNANNFRTIPELFIGQQNPILNGNQQPLPGNYAGTPFFLQTGSLAINAFNVFGVEKLFVSGPFSWQSEAMVNVMDRVAGPIVTMPGFYSQVGYFLTGEHRPYDRKAGAIDRVMPFENFFRVQADGCQVTGWGAWEVAARISYLDFHSVDRVASPTAGGDLLDTTLGINWYWNPYTKIVANWVHSFLDNPTTGRSHSDGFGLRAQVDF